MARMIIYGAGGLGAEALEIVRRAGRHEVCAFLDADPRRHGATVDGVVVAGGPEQLPELRAAGVRSLLVAVGANRVRAELAARFAADGFELISAIHPTAALAASVLCAAHVIVGARASICVHAQIAAHAVISTGAIIEHDNVIETAAFVEPAARLAGGVRVGAGARVGIGACVIPGRTIGADAIVAPGAVVIRDVPAGAVVAGAPARLTAASALARAIPVANQPTSVAGPRHPAGVGARRA